MGLKNKIAVRPNEIIEARYSLTQRQNNIIDVLLTQLKDDGNYSYELNIDDFKDIYKSDTSNIYRDMKKACKSFEGLGFYIVEKEKGEETWYSWFSKIVYKNKQGKIILNIDPDLKKLLMESSRTVPYEIKYTLNFSSVYTHRIYLYLKRFEDTGWRIETIDNLLTKMECPKSYYNSANLKKYVLEVAKNELNSSSNSDIGFDYDFAHEGRKVTRIKFTIFKNENKNKIIEVVNDKESNYKKLSVESIKDMTGDKLTTSDCNKILKVYKGKTDEELLNDYIDFKEKVSIVDKYVFENNKENEPYIALLLTSIKKNWSNISNSKNKTEYGNYTSNNSKRFKNKDNTNFSENDYKELEKAMFAHYQQNSLFDDNEAAIGRED